MADMGAGLFLAYDYRAPYRRRDDGSPTRYKYRRCRKSPHMTTRARYISQENILARFNSRRHMLIKMI